MPWLTLYPIVAPWWVHTTCTAVNEVLAFPAANLTSITWSITFESPIFKSSLFKSAVNKFPLPAAGGVGCAGAGLLFLEPLLHDAMPHPAQTATIPIPNFCKNSPLSIFLPEIICPLYKLPYD
jgi:hypothetical protein